MVSFLVLTEDSGDQGFPTVAALLRAMLRKLDQKAKIEEIELEPTEDANALRSLRGNSWKGTDKDAEFYRKDLVRSIATKLAEGGFVVFHIDGDKPWKQRKQCENTEKFGKVMDVRIRQLLMNRLGKKQAVEAAMKRLLVIVPFYSIESWLFQNTDEATRICKDKYAGKDVERFDAWSQSRSRLDEEPKPKETVCLKSKHNRHLAETNFPFDLAHGIKKSLKSAVDTLAQCDDLKIALRGLGPS